MTVTNILAATVIGALTFSSSVVAGRNRVLNDGRARNRHRNRSVVKSSANCQVVALGYSDVSNEKAIADVTADASAYICNGEKSKTAHSIATATAEAFALAVASASVACELKGDAKVQVEASSSATAAANVWLSAYAEAFAGAGDCEQCDAYATSFGYVEKEVFLKAVADAEVKLSAYTSGGRLIFSVLNYQAELKKVAVSAFAEALAAAADLKKSEGCLAWANAGGCIYTPEHPDAKLPDCGGDNLAEFECTASAVSAGAVEEIDALAEASASAAAWSCGDSVSIVELETTAKALAEATAVAISYAYASCEVDGGYACSVAYTEIEQTAYAVAESYSTLWAGALSCNNGCTVNVDATAEAVGSILVKAATDAFSDVCTDSGHWSVATLAVDVEKASLCALAEASAVAISMAPSTCLAGGIVYAGASHSECPAH